MNEADAVLIPKIDARNFLVNFSTALIVTLSPGHCDIIRFRPWSSIATDNYLGRAEKFQILLRRVALLMILIRVQAFRGPRSGELSHVQMFKNDGPNPLS
jgi:hypothetical protein